MGGKSAALPENIAGSSTVLVPIPRGVADAAPARRARAVGPIKLDSPRKGPAHYELLDQALGVPGRWEVEIDARVSAFDAYTAEADVDVREE